MLPKLKDSVKVREPLEYEYDYEDGDLHQLDQSEQPYSQQASSVGSIAEVVVMELRSFEETPQVIQLLRESKSVLLNLKNMSPEQAQRVVDFIAGCVYAISGHQERVDEMVFLFTPACVQVTIVPEGVIAGSPHDGNA